MGSRMDNSRLLNGGIGQGSNTSLSISDNRRGAPKFSTRRPTVNMLKTAQPRSVAASDDDGEKQLNSSVKLLFKPYQGDLFGNSGKDNTRGLLYLSRLDYTRDPRKIHRGASEQELGRRTLADELGVDDREDAEPQKYARRAACEERRRRLAISLATLCRKPEKRVEVVAKGGLAAIANLCRSEGSTTRCSCAQAFNNLATEKDLRQRLVEQGAVPVIIALASSSRNSVLLRECMEALCKLAVLPGSESLIIAEGGISCILAVRRAVPSLGEVCLKTLVNLSCLSGGSEKLKADELNDAVVQLAATVGDDECLGMLLIQFLCNLSGLKNNQQKLVEEDAILIIAKASERTASVEVVRLCARTLCNFAGDGRARPKMWDERTSRALLEMTRHRDVAVWREVAHAAALLAADTSCLEKVLKHGIIPTLVTMSTALPDEIDVSAGCYIGLAFRVLSSKTKSACLLVDGGAVDGLIALTRSPDKSCRLSCAQSLCDLIRLGVRRDYLIDRGVISALVGLVELGDEAMSECFGEALCHLLPWPPGLLALVDGKEIIHALHELCRVGGASVRKRCVAAILDMTNSSNNNMEEASPEGGEKASETILLLSGQLQTESDRELKANCAAALYNLARNQANCQAMIVSGAVLPIVALAETGSFETRTHCMAILQRMLLGRSIPDEIMTKSVVRTLLETSKVEHRDTQHRVVIAVYRISCCSRGRELLLAEGAPETLVRLISKPNEEMRKGCANTLLNLASDPGREMEIAGCSAVSVLLVTALVASNSDETRHACTKALTNLLCAIEVHRGMFGDDVVWGLSTMSRTKDVMITRLCSAALCNLSCEYWKDIATSNCVKDVYDLAQSEDVAVMTAGMKTLHNVLLRAQRLHGMDHIFSSTVPLASRALEHESKDVRLVGLRLTALVSTTAASRKTAMRHSLLECISSAKDFGNDEPLCYSLCCALERFALDPATHSFAGESGWIVGFLELGAVSARILERLARFLYSVSCSPEHVGRLVLEHDCVRIPEAVVMASKEIVAVVGHQTGGCGDEDGGARTGSLHGARDTCAALLFNLSTQDEVKAELVLKGATRLALMLSDGAGPEARRNCSLVVCNLAVGKVNTAKMVQHGAGKLLVELVSTTHSDMDADVRRRASAAFRNFLCASGNHAQLAREAAIPALMELAEMENSVVRRNCASALRSTMRSAEIRQLLVASGAIEIILDDARNQEDDDIPAIDNKLLCEIEAESWANGTRDILVESRAPPLPRLPQNCSLLSASAGDDGETMRFRTKGTSRSDDDYGLYRMPWKKLQALDVTLLEPDMEVSTSKEAGTQQFDGPAGVTTTIIRDFDMDGLEGLASSIRVSCGKLEPRENPLGRSSNDDDDAQSVKGPRESGSLEMTSEDDFELSSEGSSAATEEDRRDKGKQGSSTIGGEEGGKAEAEAETDRGKPRHVHRPRNLDPLVDPRGKDWEVAVVMASKDVDDMVQNYQKTRQEMNPARRGSIAISSVGASRRRSSAFPIQRAASPSTSTLPALAGALPEQRMPQPPRARRKGERRFSCSS